MSQTIVTYDLMLDENLHNVLVKKDEFLYEEDRIINPQHIRNMMNDVFKLCNKAEEHIYLLCTSTKNKILGVFELGHGNVNSCIFDSRGAMIRALLCGAVNTFIVHNHPSGDPSPSSQDHDIGKKYHEACKLMGLNLMDFLIIGGDEYFSFRDKSLLSD